MSARAATVVAIIVVAILAGPRVGRPQAYSPLAVPALECWDDVRLFPSLSSGNFDYCRSHLRYVPGALDCFQVVDRVCLLWLPGAADWTEARSTRAHVPLRCPEGPEPPVCRRLDLQ